MWSSAASRQINYGGPTEMGMFVLAQSNPNHHHISSDHHHHVHAHSLNTTTAAGTTALGVGVIPLLTATPLTAGEEGIIGNRSNNSNIQFWQPTQQSYVKKINMFSDHGFGGIGGSTSGSTLTCQDCGNQAKKDCNHRRCRTCCRNRGFDCPTHVKSTWVPAARRRERQLIASGSSASTSGTKKPRLATNSRTTTTSHTSTSNNNNNNTPPRSFDTSTSSHHQDASFMQSLPGQVHAPAVFKCVRVTAVEDGGEDEYAYQASVKIGGHVFKGFLYDQGIVVETSSSRDHINISNFSELHLGGGGGGGSGRNVGGSLTSPPSLDTPTVVYGSSSGGGLIG
uniref:protein LATERAL ROOT PRIMORDIUM 1-like n=1 Tax=Erigeron canadensis TaxID=72917 RepID=UPI001CB8E53D|nr:protein LATERAL ROOT PRIMORDIUM 1-like [Erigeron canadensis]